MLFLFAGIIGCDYRVNLKVKL